MAEKMIHHMQLEVGTLRYAHSTAKAMTLDAVRVDADLPPDTVVVTVGGKEVEVKRPKPAAKGKDAAPTDPSEPHVFELVTPVFCMFGAGVRVYLDVPVRGVALAVREG